MGILTLFRCVFTLRTNFCSSYKSTQVNSLPVTPKVGSTLCQSPEANATLDLGYSSFELPSFQVSFRLTWTVPKAILSWLLSTREGKKEPVKCPHQNPHALHASLTLQTSGELCSLPREGWNLDPVTSFQALKDLGLYSQQHSFSFSYGSRALTTSLQGEPAEHRPPRVPRSLDCTDRARGRGHTR